METVRKIMASDYATPLIALAGTIFGGAGLEITKRWLNRAKDRTDTAKLLRDELRADTVTLRKEIVDLKAEVDKIEAEVIKWREQYLELREKYVTLRGLYEDALRQISKKAGETVQQAHDAGITLPDDMR